MTVVPHGHRLSAEHARPIALARCRSDDLAVTGVSSATATFLFTDIEGSTQLLKAYRSEYASILADHHRILREAFSAYGGREVDNQGDSFFVAFPRARDAVLAAATAQRGMAEHTWPGGATVRVRMGIHTGEADLAADRYVGMSVHRAARISSVGHVGRFSCRRRRPVTSKTRTISRASRSAISASIG